MHKEDQRQFHSIYTYAPYKEGFFLAVQDFTGKKRILNMIEFAFLPPVAASDSE